LERLERQEKKEDGRRRAALHLERPENNRGEAKRISNAHTEKKTGRGVRKPRAVLDDGTINCQLHARAPEEGFWVKEGPEKKRFCSKRKAKTVRIPSSCIEVYLSTAATCVA